MNGDADAPAVRQKWRPSLALVIGIVLTIVAGLPLAAMAAVVVLSRAPDTLLASLAGNLDRIVGAGFVIFAVTGLVGVLFWRFVTRPIHDLVRWTETVASHSHAPALPASRFGTRELARLAASFADMVARLRERSDYIETFTAHVSHELKSPLTAITGAAEVMRDAGDQMDASARARFLDNIEADAARLSALVARMRDLARAENLRPGGSARLEDAVSELRERFASLEVVSSGEVHSLPLPQVDALAVLSHLADNAAAHGARRLSIDTTIEQGRIALRISNDGAPVSPGNRARIFEPFYTTRREDGGTGMGLAIVRAMLSAYGAEISLEESFAGTCFRIAFA